MKPLLLALLALSLAANLVLAIHAARPPAPSSPARPAADVPSPPTVSAAFAIQTKTVSAPTPATPSPRFVAPHSPDDLPRFVADLRAAGYPPSLVRAVVNQLLNEFFAARQPNAGQPFWKLDGPDGRSVGAQQALANERRELFEALLGPDARPSAMLDAVIRERRFGKLADDKIDAIAKIERDYAEMTTEAWAKRQGNVLTNLNGLAQTQRLMESEKLADIARLLTPEELAQYEYRNTRTSSVLISQLRNTEITEAEYSALYRAQETFDTANPPLTTMDSAAYTQRLLGRLALNEQVREVLGDQRFYSYLEGTDREYAVVAQTMTKYSSVAPATTYQVYRLQAELQSLLTRPGSAGGMTPEQIAAMQTTVEAYNTRLDALLGPQVADAYRSQATGRVFMAFPKTPRPPAKGG